MSACGGERRLTECRLNVELECRPWPWQNVPNQGKTQRDTPCVRRPHACIRTLPAHPARAAAPPARAASHPPRPAPAPCPRQGPRRSRPSPSQSTRAPAAGLGRRLGALSAFQQTGGCRCRQATKLGLLLRSLGLRTAAVPSYALPSAAAEAPITERTWCCSPLPSKGSATACASARSFTAWQHVRSRRLRVPGDAIRGASGAVPNRPALAWHQRRRNMIMASAVGKRSGLLQTLTANEWGGTPAVRADPGALFRTVCSADLEREKCLSKAGSGSDYATLQCRPRLFPSPPWPLPSPPCNTLPSGVSVCLVSGVVGRRSCPIA